MLRSCHCRVPLKTFLMLRSCVFEHSLGVKNFFWGVISTSFEPLGGGSRSSLWIISWWTSTFTSQSACWWPSPMDVYVEPSYSNFDFQCPGWHRVGHWWMCRSLGAFFRKTISSRDVCRIVSWKSVFVRIFEFSLEFACCGPSREYKCCQSRCFDGCGRQTSSCSGTENTKKMSQELYCHSSLFALSMFFPTYLFPTSICNGLQNHDTHTRFFVGRTNHWFWNQTIIHRGILHLFA